MKIPKRCHCTQCHRYARCPNRAGDWGQTEQSPRIPAGHWAAGTGMSTLGHTALLNRTPSLPQDLSSPKQQVPVFSGLYVQPESQEGRSPPCQIGRGLPLLVYRCTWHFISVCDLLAPWAHRWFVWKTCISKIFVFFIAFWSSRAAGSVLRRAPWGGGVSLERFEALGCKVQRKAKVTFIIAFGCCWPFMIITSVSPITPPKWFLVAVAPEQGHL